MDSTDSSTGLDGALTSRYEAISNDPKYQHFIRIPRRIVRCFDYFGVAFDREVVERRLRAYYLFIGVIDHAMDCGRAQVGQMVLRQLDLREDRVSQSATTSDIALATEHLKREIPADRSSDIRNQLWDLNRTVDQERTATSMTDYIEVRKRVGRLTARISYELIHPLLSGETSRLGYFMERVGEIGCLVDSVIDLHTDERDGLLNFRGTPRNFVRLLTCTIKSGGKLSFEYPRLFLLFLEAVADNVLDGFRGRTGDERLPLLSERAATNQT